MFRVEVILEHKCISILYGTVNANSSDDKEAWVYAIPQIPKGLSAMVRRLQHSVLIEG
jgi:hypothetical protein